MRLPIRWRRALSSPLDAVPVTIRKGPNRGRRWSLPVSGRGFAAGRFEEEKFEALEALLSAGDVFWDVGGHYGYATLLGARIVGPNGGVWTFEPSPLNRAYLERHVRWNCPERVTVMPFALADEEGVELFGGTGSSMALGLGRGEEEVVVKTAVGLIADGIPEPTVMKIDVEGAEARALRGLLHSDARPVILCSVHDAEKMRSCAEILKQAGYVVLPARPIRDFIDGRSPWKGDPDLLALPPDSERRDRLEATELFRGVAAL